MNEETQQLEKSNSQLITSKKQLLPCIKPPKIVIPIKHNLLIKSFEPEVPAEPDKPAEPDEPDETEIQRLSKLEELDGGIHLTTLPYKQLQQRSIIEQGVGTVMGLLTPRRGQ